MKPVSAPAPRRSPLRSLEAWLLQHLRAARTSLRQIAANPLGNLMSMTVIGVALALPASLLVTLESLRQAFSGDADTYEISLFLDEEVDDRQGALLARELALAEDVAAVRFIDRATALEEYRAIAGFPEALDVLEENPLPAVVLVSPRAGPDEDASLALLQRLRDLPKVESARFDRGWARRLRAILQLLHRGGWLLSGLLALAVLLIVGNTIRLAILHRSEEIRIAKLFGATDSFVQLPFLYAGLWYGTGGGLFAWAMIAGSTIWLSGPAAELAQSYDSAFRLSVPGIRQAGVLVGIGTLLGLLGSWFSVRRHVAALEI